MPVGGESLISGAYTMSYGGSTLGIAEGDAGLPALEHSLTAEDVGNTSLYAKMVIDSISQGGNVFLSLTCLEAYLAAVRTAFWPYSATLGAVQATMGTLMYSASAALVLTAVAGTPAAASPATLTASKAILAPGFTSRIMFGPTLRKVPLRFRLYPFASSGTNYHFVVT